MAIKKYHVSANLLNPDSKTTNQYGSERYGDSFPAGTYYILNNSNTTIYYRDGISSTTGNNIEPNNSVVVTTNSLLVVWHTNYDTDIMVASSSVALPYEPYGNSFKNWFYRERETATDTLTTLPKTIIGDGQPITSYTIKGNMSQSGKPTPQNPIYPQETGDKTANLFVNSQSGEYTGGGIIVTSDGYGRYYVSGTAQTDTEVIISLKSSFEVPMSIGQGGTGVFYLFNSKKYEYEEIGYNTQLKLYYNNDLVDYWRFADINRTNSVYTAMGGRTVNKIGIYVPAQTITNFNLSPQFTNDGSVHTQYEPYGYKIPILSGNTTTTEYLGQVQSTRNIKQLVLTGEENFTARTNTSHSFQLPITLSADIAGISSHYTSISANEIDIKTGVYVRASYTVIITDLNYSDLDNFKAFLRQQYSAGTPVTVWYVLATPTTGIVNEPIRKIGDYADSVSGANLPTTGTAEQFDVDTTLKPSEVSLTYHGWHEHQDTVFSE